MTRTRSGPSVTVPTADPQPQAGDLSAGAVLGGASLRSNEGHRPGLGVTFLPLIRVRGAAAGQGSKRLVYGRMIEASPKTRPWRNAVVAACENLGVAGLGWMYGVAVDMDAAYTRPTSHHTSTGRLRKSAPVFPRRPDVDKIARSTLDALVDASVLLDDSQVVRLAVTKRYADTSMTLIHVTLYPPREDQLALYPPREDQP